MPQKNNPDVPEFVRSKPGRVFGTLMGMVVLMEERHCAYITDLQIDKE